jgi:hypothetical protein
MPATIAGIAKIMLVDDLLLSFGNCWCRAVNRQELVKMRIPF